MKYIAYGVILIIFATLVLPTIIVIGFIPARSSTVQHSSVKLIKDGEMADFKTAEVKTSNDYNTINVFVVDQNKEVKMNLEDYLVGVVAAEMPADFEMEALKAQAVAARTYALSKEISVGGKGCDLHPGSDVCTDSKHCQAWISDDVMRSRWGDKYNLYRDKIVKAVNDTKDLVIVYNDALIEPAYHAISGGETEDAKNVWQENLPYLKSVPSPGEEVAQKFKTTVTVSSDEFVNRIKSRAPKAKISTKNLLGYIKNIKRTEAGHVLSLNIGGIDFTGTDIQDLFQLNSTNFSFSMRGNNVVINVIGYGHGVGMSQYGANAMAKGAKNFEDILKHYYTGVEIMRIDDLLKIKSAKA
ncbi:stage II sporulation protein D [Thermoanaerobacterium thermosaccharolyticum]|uniref:stage II sporulation protein D n=1 Tax=Thermoanaerobacterium thermosaccharolyticum TaxID=1517 RepID=UPI000C073395|nr:stage II sporulation protein D [Thermoanaerobacterium thermosaccharolyticum]PHO07496.1 stage II sporulation protein D [Thermoanaerobacterium thermosaccharolyticum]